MAKIELRFRRPGIPSGGDLRVAGLVLGVAMAAATVVPSKAQGETGEERPLHVNQLDLLDLVKSGAAFDRPQGSLCPVMRAKEAAVSGLASVG